MGPTAGATDGAEEAAGDTLGEAAGEAATEGEGKPLHRTCADWQQRRNADPTRRTIQGLNSSCLTGKVCRDWQHRTNRHDR